MMNKLTRSTIKPGTGVSYCVKGKEYIMPDIKYVSCPHLLNQKGLDELYVLMKTVHKLFTKYNIKYFAMGGTLLGCIRHQGPIPWDDDIDIGISGDLETENKIKSLRGKLLRRGYILIHCAPGFSIQKILMPHISMDLFVIDTRDGKDYMEMAYPYITNKQGKRIPEFATQELWPWNKYKIDFHDLILWKFFDYEIYIPKNYNEILQITYNESDVMNEARYSPDQKAHLVRYIRPIQGKVEKICSPFMSKETKVKITKKILF